MAWHPAFRARIDEMIQEHKRLIIGPSYFPIELVDHDANTQLLPGQLSQTAANIKAIHPRLPHEPAAITHV